MSNFDYLGEFGYRGNGDGEFMRPVSVRVNSQGTIFVSDRDRSDVQMFTMTDAIGKSVRSIRPFEAEILFPDEDKIE